MGEEVKVIAVEIENGATLIQVDFEVGGKKDRMFIETSSILKALNNFIYKSYDKEIEKMGFELEDHETYKNPNLL